MSKTVTIPQKDFATKSDEWLTGFEAGVAAQMAVPSDRALVVKILLPFVVILFGLGCYHFGYAHGYVDAIAWAKSVRWDQ
jgi:hypothetical protein